MHLLLILLYCLLFCPVNAQTASREPAFLVSDAPALMPNFRRDCAKVRLGTGRCKAFWIGDSITAGVMATSDLTNNTGVIATELNKTIPTVLNTIWFNQPGRDPRVTIPDGWVNSGGRFFGSEDVSSAADPISFTPTGPVDKILIYWSYSPSLTSYQEVQINVDGGSPLATISNAGTNYDIAVTSLSCPRGTHTINVVPQTPVNDGGFYLEGIEGLDSTAPAICLSNAGQPGASSGSFLSPGGLQPFCAQLALYAPSVVFINLGVNDAVYYNTDPEIYASNIQNVISYCKTAGADVVLVKPTPSHQGSTDKQIILNRKLDLLAVQNHAMLIDLFNRLGGTDESVNAEFYADGLHMNDLGYKDYSIPFIKLMVGL